MCPGRVSNPAGAGEMWRGRTRLGMAGLGLDRRGMVRRGWAVFGSARRGYFYAGA